jgi:hypothetical protein
MEASSQKKSRSLSQASKRAPSPLYPFTEQIGERHLGPLVYPKPHSQLLPLGNYLPLAFWIYLYSSPPFLYLACAFPRVPSLELSLHTLEAVSE